jgi:hypothetical protein
MNETNNKPPVSFYCIIKEHSHELSLLISFLGVIIILCFLVPATQTIFKGQPPDSLVGKLGLANVTLCQAILLAANYGTIWAASWFYLILLDNKVARAFSLSFLFLFFLCILLKPSPKNSILVSVFLMLYFAILDMLLAKYDAKDRLTKERLNIGSLYISWPTVFVLLMVLAGIYSINKFTNVPTDALENILAGVFGVIVIYSNLQFLLINTTLMGSFLISVTNEEYTRVISPHS